MKTSPLLRALACATLLALGALQGACGNACLSLAQQICQCLPEDGTRATCNQRAKDGQDSFPVGANDESYCQAKLDANVCDCNNLTTESGKQACGLAYEATAGVTTVAPQGSSQK